MSESPTAKSAESAAGSARESAATAIRVRTSAEQLVPWDRAKVMDSLRQAGVKDELALDIYERVERLVRLGQVPIVPSHLVSQFISSELVAAGVVSAAGERSPLSVPLNELDEIMGGSDSGEDNFSNPQDTSLRIGRRIKTEYALSSVFSHAVSMAHLQGDIVIHGMAEVDRPASAWLTLEATQKAGLNLTPSSAVSGPARHPEVLVAHLVRYTAHLLRHFADGIGWDGLDISFAPYLADLGRRAIQQLAQRLFFELSQLDPEPSQSCVRLALYGEIPRVLGEREALGPGGRPTGRPIRDYADQAREFALALLNAYASGDAQGRGFRYPHPQLVVTRELFEHTGYREFLHQAGEAARRRGQFSFRFARDEHELSGAQPSSWPQEESQGEQGAAAILQVISVNLPRAAYLANNTAAEAQDYIDAALDVAAQAHLEKRVFIENLMARGAAGTLGLLAARGEHPLLSLERAWHLIAPSGLNELTHCVVGKELHEEKEAVRYARSLLKHMEQTVNVLSRRHKLRLCLGSSQASAARRFGELDLRYHQQALASRDASTGEGDNVHSVGIGLRAGCPTLLARRVRIEGEIGQALKVPCASRARSVELDPGSLAEFLMHAFSKSACRELTVGTSTL